MPDGSPHVVPVCPVLDADDTIVFASTTSSQKTYNLSGDPKACLVFDDYMEDWDALRGVVVFGRAEVIEGGPEWDRGRGLLYEKFPQYEDEAPIAEDDTVLVELRPDRATSWGL